MAKYIDQTDIEKQLRYEETRKLFRIMAVERYGYSLAINFNKDRPKWETLRVTCDAIINTEAPIEIVKEALEIAMKNSPNFFPKAQAILNELFVIQNRLLRQNNKNDNTLLKANDENLNREKSKSEWVKKIGLLNVYKAEQDYIEKTNLPNMPFFKNAIWGGYNRQEQIAIDILNSYEKKPTGKSN